MINPGAGEPCHSCDSGAGHPTFVGVPSCKQVVGSAECLVQGLLTAVDPGHDILTQGAVDVYDAEADVLSR